MSSFFRTAIPITLAVAFGIWNGYYAFDPAFKEHQQGSQKSIAKEDQQLNQAAKFRDNNQQKAPKADTPPSR
ncbi:hypothetical protein F4819DRAFT_448928 [Hypoxylon fuscum]|nr:hypothetical protein F4819DRAFT_448928 [Hypoxylon fuscum]